MSVLTGKVVITRKPHDCWGCGRTIPAGTKMGVSTNVGGGRIYSCYWCPVCEEYMSVFAMWECFEGELRFNDEREWQEIRQEVEMEPTG